MPYSSRAGPWGSRLTTNALMQDLQLKETRKLLVELLNLKKQTNDVRALAIRLLFRMGMIFASPVDLLLAAQYQLDYKIDISDELAYLCK